MLLHFWPATAIKAPRWRATDTQPQPTGSVWQKINNVNLGANLVFKSYNCTLGTFVQQSCPFILGQQSSLQCLDPSGGGANIPAGTTIARINPNFTMTQIQWE
jgi:hypothetical protein